VGIIIPVPISEQTIRCWTVRYSLAKLFAPSLRSLTLSSGSAFFLIKGLLKMKSLTFMWLLVVLGSLSSGAQPVPVSSQETKTSSNKKLEREILKAENLLGKAIVTRDVAALDRLLTDYYADSYEDSERATTKKTALEFCRAGTLEFYRINTGRTITRRVDIVTIEGVARSERRSEGKAESESKARVKRLWTKKSGRWQLLAQSLDLVD
jgi:hypothetical protein